MFVLKSEGAESILLSFSGDGNSQIKRGKDGVIQPVDKVVVVVAGDATNLKAVGQCAFQNPYRGKPSRITCVADTRSGKFSAAFLSDGSKPTISGP